MDLNVAAEAPAGSKAGRGGIVASVGGAMASRSGGGEEQGGAAARSALHANEEANVTVRSKFLWSRSSPQILPCLARRRHPTPPQAAKRGSRFVGGSGEVAIGEAERQIGRRLEALSGRHLAA